jgi:hypothetical protein
MLASEVLELFIMTALALLHPVYNLLTYVEIFLIDENI